MANTEINTTIEKIKRRILNNDRGIVWLTPEVSLETKTIVRDAKKNYAGLFQTEEPDKVFWPLAKTHVDSITGNLDYDTGDIKVVAKSAAYKGTAYLLSELLRTCLKKGKFGRLMNEAANALVRDGVVVVRSNHNDLRAKYPESYIVDIENLWTDFNDFQPTWFCERVPMPRYKLPKAWNKDVIDKSPTSKFKEVGDQTHDDTVIAYRYEGLMPRGWINGTNDEDEVYGLLWITGMEKGAPYIQSRRILGKDMYSCSYDYAQFVPNQNRFISVGIPEALVSLQKYVNLVINNRVQRGNLASTGLIEIRKGSGITPQDVNNLVQGGAILVTQLGADIRSTPVQDVSPVSFTEEASINNTASQLTGSTEISRGQVNRSGTTLGQANLEAGFSSQRFQYHREAIGFMFESILDKWLTMIIANMDEEETINFTNEQVLQEVSMELAKYDRRQTAKAVGQEFGPAAEEQVANDNSILQSMYEGRVKKNEWKLIKKNLENFDYKIEVSVNSESKDLNAIANNIVQSLPIVAQTPGGQELIQPMVDKLMEILGLSKFNF